MGGVLILKGGAVSLSEADVAAHVLADRWRPVSEMQLYAFPRMPSGFGITTCCVILAEVCVCVLGAVEGGGWGVGVGGGGVSYVFGEMTRECCWRRENLFH